MKAMNQENNIKAETGMLIRCPIDEVFEAFMNPTITTQFWFTKSSGRLDQHQEVVWSWEMYNHTLNINVKSIAKNKSIIIEWPNYGQLTTVEWTFDSLSKNQTFVTVRNSGFMGSANEIYQQALDSTEGFTLMLAGAKAYLEYGIKLNLVADRFPKGLQ